MSYLPILVSDLIPATVSLQQAQSSERYYSSRKRNHHLVDDTTLFLEDASLISDAIDTIESFSNVSGLFLNISQCELLALKNDDSSIYNIPMKYSVNYLGIVVNKKKKHKMLT